MSDFPERYRMSRDVVTRDFDDGILIVNLESGKTWKLNQVGAAVCRAIEGGGDLGQVVAQLHRQYDIAIDSLRNDVEALLGNLESEGIVLLDPSA